MLIINPVRIRTGSFAAAQALAAHVGQVGAPVRVQGQDVIVPGDQPGFLFSVLDYAAEQGHATDHDCAQAIVQMEAGLP